MYHRGSAVDRRRATRYPGAITDESANTPDGASNGTLIDNPATANPELTGGAGFMFGDGVAAMYAVALLGESTAPGLPSLLPESVTFQSS